VNKPVRIGIGGPVGSGKTALVDALCKAMREQYRLGVITNDIFTREDMEFLVRHGALPAARAVLVEATRRFPTHAGTFNNLGSLLLQMGDADGAARHLSQALQLAPSFNAKITVLAGGKYSSSSASAHCSAMPATTVRHGMRARFSLNAQAMASRAASPSSPRITT